MFVQKLLELRGEVWYYEDNEKSRRSRLEEH